MRVRSGSTGRTCTRKTTDHRSAGAGGHEKWTHSDLFRPIIIQSHIHPVPERCARNLIKLLGISRDDYHEIMDWKKKVRKEKERYVVVKG